MSGGQEMFGNLGTTALLAILPFVVIVGTSFAKISVVLGIMRSALGAPGVPPTTVLAGLAVVMSIFIMAPVATDVADAVEEAIAGEDRSEQDDPLGMARARAIYAAGSSPLLDFLRHNTPDSEVAFFEDLAGEKTGKPGLRIMLPAFAVSELVEAFLIGFLVFIPFLLIDLIVGNALQAMGMHMTPPAAVALPLKLLLFITADGWHLLVSGLVVSYGM